MKLMHPSVTSAALVHAERFSVAPMVGHTHRHTRYFLRLLSRHSWLYTEMTHAEAVVAAAAADLSDADGSCAPLWRGPEPPGEHGCGPVALQLGGREPNALAAAAAVGTRLGYDAINLNCGCPSGPVAGEWREGAALMREPQLVAAACEAMLEASARAAAQAGVPPPLITVKHRLAVTDANGYDAASDMLAGAEADLESCRQFVRRVSAAGVRRVQVHARKGLLGYGDGSSTDKKGSARPDGQDGPTQGYGYSYSSATVASRHVPWLGMGGSNPNPDPYPNHQVANWHVPWLGLGGLPLTLTLTLTR